MGRRMRKSQIKKMVREVKYFSPDTDYEALEQELSHNDVTDDLDELETGYKPNTTPEPTDDELEEYAQWALQAAQKAEKK